MRIDALKEAGVRIAELPERIPGLVRDAISL